MTENIDEELTMTSEAICQGIRLQETKKEWQGLCLRLYLEGKGCDGFYYGITFDKQCESDLSFKQVSTKGSFNLICDEETLGFVRGSEISWQDNEKGVGFIVNNPRHKRFRGKFYKRGYWQKKLKEKKEANTDL